MAARSTTPSRTTTRTRASIVALRLNAQSLARPASASPAGVVSSLVALQAQDLNAATWAVGLRMRGDAREADIRRALAEGSVLRSHVMRWTWQLVCPADIRWLLALAAPGLFARHGRRHRELGLDARTFRRSRSAIERALGDGSAMTRDELSAVLARAGVAADGPRLSHLLGHAELDGAITSGPPRGQRSTHMLLDLRAPDARSPLPRAEAAAELARRYFESRGPATVPDFAWWSGLSVGEARAGVAAVRSTLLEESVDGETTWRSATTRVPPPRGAHLLPAFDEYLVAYRDRDAMLDPHHAKRVNAGGGMLGPCVVLDGRVVGVWRRTLGRERVTVEVDLLQAVPQAARRALAAAVRRYGAFLERELEFLIRTPVR